MISASELAYRERLLEDTRQWAQVQMPALLRSVHGQRLQSLQIAAAPATPLPDTGSIPRLRETAMIPSIKLHKPALAIADTSELVSKAVRLFIDQHGCLPTRCLLNPMRVLSIDHSPSYFPLDDQCADLGAYTISVGMADGLASDTVCLLARDPAGEAIREDFAL